MRWILAFFILTQLNGNLAKAEPWLSNRFAQNCAGCHAPGRKNLEPIERRCTLSCKGCHVNPSGGGMRNFYGKWNEERWLRSFKSSFLKNQNSVAPYKAQLYGKKTATHKTPGTKQGLELQLEQNSTVDESLYDRRDGIFQHTAKSEEEMLFQIPQDDPYRQRLQQKTDGGADIRYLSYDRTAETTTGGVTAKQTTNQSFLMAADFGVRYRPIYRHVNFVYEGRFLGQPGDDTKRRDTFKSANTRSLYAMVDDLPYSLYVMGGYYRPQFGNLSADHTQLPQRMFASAVQGYPRSQNLLFEAVSLGGSPNVPFANVHLIQGQIYGNDDVRMRGWASNLGARFVTLAASASYSYWSTKTKGALGGTSGELTDIDLAMHAINFGGQLGPVTANIEAMRFAKNHRLESFRKGAVMSLDMYVNLWRQVYGQLFYARSNTAETLKPGMEQQIRYGLRGFLYPGVDLSFYFETAKSEQRDSDEGPVASQTKSQSAVWQLHLFM